MTRPTDRVPVPDGYRDLASAILAKLPEATRRDQMAFAYGYVVAFEAMASVLPSRRLIHHRFLALALIELSAEEPR